MAPERQPRLLRPGEAPQALISRTGGSSGTDPEPPARSLCHGRRQGSRVLGQSPPSSCSSRTQPPPQAEPFAVTRASEGAGTGRGGGGQAGGGQGTARDGRPWLHRRLLPSLSLPFGRCQSRVTPVPTGHSQLQAGVGRRCRGSRRCRRRHPSPRAVPAAGSAPTRPLPPCPTDASPGRSDGAPLGTNLRGRASQPRAGRRLWQEEAGPGGPGSAAIG